jgi:death on curing protein
VKEPRWITREGLVRLHLQSLQMFGGPEGLRDNNMLESALGRPLNQFHYGGAVDIALLAAAYAFGIARNHPFVDGNKRAAFLAVGLFLGKNGYLLVADQADAISTFLALAAGDLTEDQLATWIRDHMVVRSS